MKRLLCVCQSLILYGRYFFIAAFEIRNWSPLRANARNHSTNPWVVRKTFSSKPPTKRKEFVRSPDLQQVVGGNVTPEVVPSTLTTGKSLFDLESEPQTSDVVGDDGTGGAGDPPKPTEPVSKLVFQMPPGRSPLQRVLVHPPKWSGRYHPALVAGLRAMKNPQPMALDQINSASQHH